jgi:hypothetical protein
MVSGQHLARRVLTRAMETALDRRWAGFDGSMVPSRGQAEVKRRLRSVTARTTQTPTYRSAARRSWDPSGRHKRPAPASRRRRGPVALRPRLWPGWLLSRCERYGRAVYQACQASPGGLLQVLEEPPRGRTCIADPGQLVRQPLRSGRVAPELEVIVPEKPLSSDHARISQVPVHQDRHVAQQMLHRPPHPHFNSGVQLAEPRSEPRLPTACVSHRPAPRPSWLPPQRWRDSTARRGTQPSRRSRA